MIVVIDDRTPRQKQKIGDRTPPDFVSLKKPPEIIAFMQAVLNDEHPNLAGARVLAVHRNIPQLNNETAKTLLVEYCKQKNLPLIWFGGDYSYASSVEEGRVFICNASIFYDRLLNIENIDGDHVPERLLFGEGYKVSLLLSIRRLIKFLIQIDELDELEDMIEDQFMDLGYTCLFHSIMDVEDPDEKLRILNLAIEKELRSLWM
ncbi:hypothetical protein [Phaeodactylibacter xiamenensis]|uniref:hypothetical protein n=1 Tax=Phaeodactylibacter xiamenensis TaxID=1524460 RepID=UPI0024A9FE92|nr:hypothetical protein [Phaeodactylibacter xiamenensis]